MGKLPFPFGGRKRAAGSAENIDAIVTKPLTLITGGSSGIGAAMATEFAEAGHNLLLIGQDQARLGAVVDRVSGLGEGEVLSIALDLTDLTLHQLIDELLLLKGYHVEVLINNAGIGERDDFLTSSFEDLKAVVDLNIDVLTALSHRYLPGMVQRGEGALLNISSIGGLAPGPYNAVYYASKAYVTNLTEALANEVRGRGVYIAAVLPGPTKTPFHYKINGQNSLYHYVLWRMKPRAVARSVHRALLMGHWAVVTPGIVYAAFGLFLRVVPGSLLAPFMGILYKPRKLLGGKSKD